jgi:hypothetical protein
MPCGSKREFQTQAHTRSASVQMRLKRLAKALDGPRTFGPEHGRSSFPKAAVAKGSVRDLHPGSVERARQCAQESGVANVTFVEFYDSPVLVENESGSKQPI